MAKQRRRGTMKKMKTITIKRPRIVKVSDHKTRLVTEIDSAGNWDVSDLWIEVDSSYTKYMVTENCDGPLCFAFVKAMRQGYNIVCEAPVSENLLFNLNEFAQIAYKNNKSNKKLFLPKITADICENLPSKGAVVAPASFGADSFYAINKFLDSPYPNYKLTHLMHNDVLEFRDFRSRFVRANNKTMEEAEEIANKLKSVARNNVIEVSKELGLECLFFDTNAADFKIPSNQYYVFINYGYIGHSFSKLFGTIIQAGSYDISYFDITDVFNGDNNFHELLNIHTFTTIDSNGGIRFVADTFHADRIEKLEELALNPLVHKYLSVCWFTQDGKNCNVCDKCKRTMIMLDYLGVLDKFSNSFDVDYYYKNFNDEYKEYLLTSTTFEKNLRIDKARYIRIRDAVINKHKKISKPKTSKAKALKLELQKLQGENKKLQKRIRIMQNSTSWRLTKPIRKVAKAFKRDQKK